MDCSTQLRSSTHRRCHSRNHHQQDIIFDFLTSLDQSKTAFQWQSEVNQINDDWHEMMQTQPENNEEEPSKQNASNKRVTWSEDLLDIRTISPRQSQVFKANQLNSSEKSTFSSQQTSGTSNRESCGHYLCSVGDGHHCRLKAKNKPHILEMAFMPLFNSNLKLRTK